MYNFVQVIEPVAEVVPTPPPQPEIVPESPTATVVPPELHPPPVSVMTDHDDNKTLETDTTLLQSEVPDST